jgi:molybdopterin-dependent oxidoreductase alpha subunit
MSEPSDNTTTAPAPPVTPAYDGPAGGWGALKSVALHLKEQRIAVKGTRTLLAANQPDGFDCPGCAWPDRQHGSSFEFCENGAKAVAAEATAKRATPEVFAQHTVSWLAQQSDHFLEDLGRLTQPMVYDAASDHYRPIDWDAAFALIGDTLRALPDPNRALFYTSGRTSNEAAFLWQLFVREYGSNNFPDCSNMCHEPSGVALKRAIGVGKGTVSLDDFTLADAIFSFGHNPGTNHPRMLGELRAAARRGARIVSFNPLKERGLERFADPQSPFEMATLGSTPISSHYFQPRVGGDLAVLKALCKRVIELDDQALAAGRPRVVDAAFIAEHTEGFEAFAAELRAVPWDALVQASGLTQAQLFAAAEVYVQAERVIVAWGMGITQHRRSVATIEMIAALLLLRGNLGKPGAGVCPVRGHSNVQGDRTMGIDERPSAAFLDRLQQVFGFEPPREHGLNTVESIAAMLDGEAEVFIGLGGNFAASTPDTEATARALRRCALTVHVSTKFNRSHVVHGRRALLLPCLGRTELDLQQGRPQAITVEDSMSMVHRSVGRNPPASPHLKSEPEIVAGIAQATLPDSKVKWAWLVQDHDRIRDLIAEVFDDFAGFNQRVAVPGGFRLPNAAAERRWNTATQRANFAVHALDDGAPAPAATAEAPLFTLTTIRSHDQYNTTIYGLHDRYRGVHGERRVLFVHPEDIAQLGLEAGAAVDLTSVHGDERRLVQGFRLVPYDIPRGCVAAYYPETNPLVPLSSVAEGAGTPTSKAVPVLITPSSLQR